MADIEDLVSNHYATPGSSVTTTATGLRQSATKTTSAISSVSKDSVVTVPVTSSFLDVGQHSCDTPVKNLSHKVEDVLLMLDNDLNQGDETEPVEIHVYSAPVPVTLTPVGKQSGPKVKVTPIEPNTQSKKRRK